MKRIFAFGIILFCFGTGCASVSVVDSSIKSIELKQSEKRSFGLTSFEFPAGVYTPDFQTKDGIYYRASAKMVQHLMGMSKVSRGGLFVPFPKSQYRMQGA